MSEERWTEVRTAADVTEEILELLMDEAEAQGLGGHGPIEWEDVLDPVEGLELRDGSRIDFGSSLDSPAIRKIKREVRARLRAS